MAKGDRADEIVRFFLHMPACFKLARSKHDDLARRLSQRMTWNSDEASMRADAKEFAMSVIAEAWDDLVLDGSMTLESLIRVLSDSIYQDALNADAYMWGLAIAGIYHCWECGAKDVVASVQPTDPKMLRKADFAKLIGFIERTGFEVQDSDLFERLRVVSFIANTAKHQDGPSKDALMMRRPDLFVEERGELELRVGAEQFDEAIDAITQFWKDYGAAHQRGLTGQ